MDSGKEETRLHSNILTFHSRKRTNVCLFCWVFCRRLISAYFLDSEFEVSLMQLMFTRWSKTNLAIHSLVSVLCRLQDIAVKMRVWEAADGQTSTTRHQNLKGVTNMGQKNILLYYSIYQPLSTDLKWPIQMKSNLPHLFHYHSEPLRCEREASPFCGCKFWFCPDQEGQKYPKVKLSGLLNADSRANRLIMMFAGRNTK